MAPPISRLPERHAPGHNPFMPRLTTHLYIVRHAWAEDVGPEGDDHGRRLTKKGRKRFAALMRRLRERCMQVDLVATSPLVRARETAELLAAAFDDPPPIEVVDALAPGSDWPALVAWTIRQDAARVAWVGHMPCVGRLVALSIGDGSAAIRMQKGAIASIRLDDGPGHGGELEWLATDEIA
jgi:phosphohistidine phosphatase